MCGTDGPPRTGQSLFLGGEIVSGSATHVFGDDFQGAAVDSHVIRINDLPVFLEVFDDMVVASFFSETMLLVRLFLTG